MTLYDIEAQLDRIQAHEDKLWPPRQMYEPLEIENLSIAYDLVDVEAVLDDLTVTRWFVDKGIVGPNAQKRAIRGMLAKRQRELEATRDLRIVVAVEPSRELNRSALVRRRA